MIFQESLNSLENYLVDNLGFESFESQNIGDYLSQVLSKKKEDTPSLKNFSNCDIKYKSLDSKLRKIQKGKNSIDKKIGLETKEDFFYKPVQFFSDLVYGKLKKRLEKQKSRLDGFKPELDKEKRRLDRDRSLLKKGFDNLCYSFVDADSLINEYLSNIDYNKESIGEIKLFSFNFLKNLKERKKLKSEIKDYRDKIKAVSKKREDIKNSLSSYKIFFDKNEKDRLFIDNLGDEKNYHYGILGGYGDTAYNLSNDQKTYSLGSLKFLKKFYNKPTDSLMEREH